MIWKKHFSGSWITYCRRWRRLPAAHIASEVSRRIHGLRNPAGGSFFADFSTPGTHLLYGCHVWATPDGRKAREALGYGIDPRRECAVCGRVDQLPSQRKLGFGDFLGGYASHLGLAPKIFSRGKTVDEKMGIFAESIIKPLFCFNSSLDNSPYYVYFNLDSRQNLRQVLAHPEKYAPNGIYIMRIHGTFVNFLVLSPAIQEDIIARLDADETQI